MRKKIFITCSILSACSVCFAQITIEECYRKAQANYPLIKQYDLMEKTKEYSLANANKGYLPQIMLSGKASYQSDVAKIPFEPAKLGIPNLKIPIPDKDQYGMSLDVMQMVWDGGEIKSNKDIIRTNTEVKKKTIDVSIYAINERINQLFFGILLTKAKRQQNKLLKEELQRNLDRIKAYVANGIANQTDLDALHVGLLKTEQLEEEYIYTQKAYMEMLSKLTGTELDINTEFVKPAWEQPTTSSVNRPELTLFDAQIKNCEAENERITAGLYPKLALFVTGGYGKPALNPFENKFAPYYIAGIKLSWNMSAFYTQKNRRKLIQNSMKQIETQREVFLFNTRLAIIQKNKVVEKYTKLLKYDDEIIRLKASLKQASETKMANGTISGTDLMGDILAEQTAVQDKILHEMALLLAVYDLKFATNN